MSNIRHGKMLSTAAGSIGTVGSDGLFTLVTASIGITFWNLLTVFLPAFTGVEQIMCTSTSCTERHRQSGAGVKCTHIQKHLSDPPSVSCKCNASGIGSRAPIHACFTASHPSSPAGYYQVHTMHARQSISVYYHQHSSPKFLKSSAKQSEKKKREVQNSLDGWHSFFRTGYLLTQGP